MWRIWRTDGWRRAMEEAAGVIGDNPKLRRLESQAEKILAEVAAPENLKDNPYKGKPLELDPENPFDKGLGMANRVLKNAGLKPPWMEAKEEILAEKKALRRMMDQHLERLEVAARAGASSPARLAELKVDHERFLALLRERIEKLHKKILLYNLEVPLIDQQVHNVRFEPFTEELRAAAGRLLGEPPAER